MTYKYHEKDRHEDPWTQNPKNQTDNIWPSIIIIVFFSITAAVCMVSCDEPAHASEIKEQDAVLSILGEARSEGYEGMYAIACAIRNRGTLNGVYGRKALIWKEGTLYAKNFRTGQLSEVIPPALYQKASKAWHESLSGPDVTGNSTHWETMDFNRPYWASDEITIIGKHIFYVVSK